MNVIQYGCGCKVTRVDSEVTGVESCEEHAHFSVVQRGWRVLVGALEEAHEQLPPAPTPPRAA